MLSFEDPSIVFQVKKGTILEASAGSGKTTILTERWLASFLYLLVWEKYSVSEALHGIVALTFTKKAATEMKHRIRIRLNELWDNNELAEFLDELKKYNGDFPDSLESVLEHLNNQKNYIDDLLSSAKIMTINAFVFYLLRAYPLELNKDIGLNPEEGSYDVSATERETQILLLRKLILQEYSEYQPYFKLGVQLVGLNTWIKFFEQIRLLISKFGDSAIHNGLQEYSIYQSEISEIVKSENPLSDIYKLIKPSVDEVVKALETENSKKSLPKDSVALYQDLSNCTEETLLTLFNLSFKEPKPVKDEELNELRIDVYNAYQRLIDKLYSVMIPLMLPVSDLCTQELKKRQAEYGEISFGDSEIVLLDSLKNPSFLQKAQAHLRFFFADEYQDTSDLQKEIFDNLISNNNIIPFFVGDPKQSIYAFRGANVYVFDQTVEEFLDKDYSHKLLNTNYRSSKDHVDLVNFIFNDVFQNSHITYQNQLPKKEDKGEFQYTLALGLEDEEKHNTSDKLQQAYIEALSVIQKMLDDNVSPGEIMVLFRNRASILEFYRFAKEYDPQLPLSSSVKNILWDNNYISPLVSFLKVLLRPHHDLTLIELLKTPIFHKSDVEINSLLAQSEQNSLFDTLPQEDKTLIQEFLILRDKVPLEELISLLVSETNYEEYLDLISETGEARATLSLFIEEAQQLQQKKEMTLGDFINAVEQRKSETEEAEFSGEEGKTLRLMTIHSAKGLESPNVIYVHKPKKNEEKAKFPMYKQNRVAFNIFGKGIVASELSDVYLNEYLEEEKRLAYVACTRAKNNFVFCALPSVVRSSKDIFKTQWEAFLNIELIEKSYPNNKLELLEIQKRESLESSEDLSEYVERAEWLAQQEFDCQELPQFLSVSLLLDVEFNPDKFYDKYLRRSFDLVESLRELAEEEEFTLQTPSQSEIGTMVHKVLQEFDSPNREEILTYLQNHFPEKESAFTLVLSYACGYWESDFYQELTKQSDMTDKERQVVYLLPNDIMIRAIADLYSSGKKHTIVDYKLSIGKNLERYHRQLSYYALLSERANQPVDEIVLFSLKEGQAYPLEWDRDKTQKQFDTAVQQAMQFLTKG